MADIFTKRKRSEVMSRIRGKDTKPEVSFRKALHRLGFRYRLHAKGLPGKPDIVLPKYRTAIFVHGCFWHGHRPCKVYRLPKTNREFWAEKIAGNRSRDRRNVKALLGDGWRVAVVWECALQGKDSNLIEANELKEWIVKNPSSFIKVP